MYDVSDVYIFTERGSVSTGDMTPGVCKGCGCSCDCCGSEPNSYLDLHQQIAELHNQLQRSNAHITNVEQELIDNKTSVDLEVLKVREDHLRLRDRYDRLLESHKKMQKLNHDLEDKLLKTVGKFESEKVSLQHEVSSLMSKVVDARMLIQQLDEENERYRNDCNMAVQLLQCKPSNFVAHRLNTLPLDLQERVRQHMSRDQLAAAERLNGVHQEEQRLLRVPMATFPPTAIMYSLDHNSKRQNQEQQYDTNDKGYVPVSLIARILTQSDSRKTLPRSFLCMKCKTDIHFWDKGCQVDLLPNVSYNVKVSSRPGMYSKKHSHSNSSHNGEEGSGYIDYQRKREHCLSTSSTETEI